MFLNKAILENRFLAVFSGIEIALFFQWLRKSAVQSQRDCIIQPKVGPTPGGPTLGGWRCEHNPERVAYQNFSKADTTPSRLRIPWLFTLGSSFPRNPGLVATIPLGLRCRTLTHQTPLAIPPKTARNRKTGVKWLVVCFLNAFLNWVCSAGFFYFWPHPPSLV